MISLQILCEYFIQCAKQRKVKAVTKDIILGASPVTSGIEEDIILGASPVTSEIEKYVNLTDKVEISSSSMYKGQNQTGNFDNSVLGNQTEMPKMLSDKTNIPDKLHGSGSVPSSTSRYSEYSGKIKIRAKSHGPRLRSPTITPSQPVADTNTEKATTKITQLSPQEPSGVVLPSSGVLDGISSEVLQYCRTQSSSTVETENQNTAGPIVPEPPMSRNGQYSLNGRDPRYSRHLLDLVTTLALQNEVSGVLLCEKIKTIDLRLKRLKLSSHKRNLAQIPFVLESIMLEYSV